MSTRSKVKRQVRRNMREHPKARRRREARSDGQRFVHYMGLAVDRLRSIEDRLCGFWELAAS